MAYSTDTLLSSGKNTAVATTSIDFDKFAQHSIPRFTVGFKVADGEGNTYRYTHFGDDVAVGVVVSTDLSESSVVDTDDAVIASASAVTTSDGLINNRFIQVTLASVTAGQYAGGRLIITDDAGEGYTYDILGNTATDDPASGDIRIELKQPLQVALTTASDLCIAGSPYSNCEIATTTDIQAAGVSCAAMDVSAAAYGWIQTSGVVGILQDGTIAIGNTVQLSDSTSGAVQIFGGAVASAVAASDLQTDPILGFCLIAGDTGGHGAFKINLE